MLSPFLCFTIDPSPVLPSKVRGAHLPQEYALARLIQDIEPPHASWSRSTPACEWKGVSCDKQKRITKLHWYSGATKLISRVEMEQRFLGSLRWVWIPESLLFCSVAYNRLSGDCTNGCASSSPHVLVSEPEQVYRRIRLGAFATRTKRTEHFEQFF